jgi:hypothetical protein
MKSNRLKLNPDKTQFIWIGGRAQLKKINFVELLRVFPDLTFQDTVVDLGITLDCELSFSSHVGRLSQSCFYQLRQIRQIRRTLGDDATKTLINAFVVSRIDYCNAIYNGSTAIQTSRIQRILNASARIILRTPKFSHISVLLKNELHWLPVTRRVQFKTLLLVHNSLFGRAPAYLRELCIPLDSIQDRRQLRSSNQSLLVVPRCHSAAFQKRGFAVAGPSAWNSLPLTFRSGSDTSHEIFKKELKTYLFHH